MICWPFRPNWSSPYVEGYAYLTEVIVSDSGREQRRAYRVDARRSVSYDAMAHRDQLRALLRTLAKPGQVIAFPDEVNRVVLPNALATGDNVVAFPSAPAWLETGRLVILEDRTTHEREFLTVDSLVSGSLSFAEAASRDWAVRSWIMPAFEGTIDSPTKVAAKTTEILTTNFKLTVEPGTEFETVGAAPVSFAGREVLAHNPNWSDDLQFDTTDPTEFLDYQVGVRAPYRLIDFNTDVRRASHVIKSPADVNATLGCFLRAKGRRGEFYLPSGLNDIALAATTGNGSQTWSVAGWDFADAYADDTVRKAFAVRKTDGRMFYFRVSGIARSTSGPAMSLITTIEAAPESFVPTAIDRISWMPVSRFASDEISVNWITNTVATVVLSTQTLEAL